MTWALVAGLRGLDAQLGAVRADLGAVQRALAPHVRASPRAPRLPADDLRGYA